MSSSAITTQIAQLKAGNIQNQADSTSIYSNGVWSFKNSTALTSVTISDAGNVGIGTASPAVKLQVEGSIRIPASTGFQLGNGSTYFYTTAASNGDFVLGTSSVDRMRIDASGNFLVGTTGANVGRIVSKGVGDSYPAFRAETNLTTSQQQISFVNPNGIVGTITSSGTATAYNTGASDYRLKEQVQALSGGLNKIKSLRPVSFVWKADQRQDIGFIAHEVQPVIPECVSGEKDGVDAEGNPSYQSIFPAPAQMIANLVAAIQELSAKNEALEARLAALEAKP